MRPRTSVFIATSLDGFIAREDGGIDWLDHLSLEGEDQGYEAFMADVDLLVMGRATFETVLGFGQWPYGTRRMVVMSRTLASDAIPEALRATVSVHAGPVDEALLESFAAKGATHAYVDGGLLIQAFLQADLIDDMIITRLPVLLGAGRPLFGALAGDRWWRHEATTAFPSGLVQSRYVRMRNP